MIDFIALHEAGINFICLLWFMITSIMLSNMPNKLRAYTFFGKFVYIFLVLTGASAFCIGLISVVINGFIKGF